MSVARLEVVAAGPLVSVQDGGRRGVMRYGLAASGPMDRRALAIANAALGNACGAAGIEVSPGGLTLACREGAVTLAIAGGGFVVEVAGARLGSWQVVTLRAGERITIRQGPWGSWCCLAFAGALQAPRWLGSRATHAASGLGGGLLRAGDAVTVTDARVLGDGAPRAIPCPVWARPRRLLRATAGPQDRFFPPEALDDLRHGLFRMTAAFDRMGVRLAGPSLTPDAALGIPSEPILRGSVQVAGDGVATVLMADHQTTGGYPKIATVLSCDTDGFAQCRPGDRLAFRLVTPAEAITIARHEARVIATFLHRLRQTPGPIAR